MEDDSEWGVLIKMLYNREAVKNWTPTTVHQRRISRDVERCFMHLNRPISNDMESYFEVNCRAKKPINKLKRLSALIYYATRHEDTTPDGRKFKGLRTAEETLIGKYGHCIEINNLLYASIKKVIPELNNSLGVIIAKNPKGFFWGAGGIDDLGIHSFISADIDGKKYMADAVGGIVTPFKNHFHAITTPTKRELASFLMWAVAEDLSFSNDRHDEALDYVNTALACDPNNYTAFVLNGEIRHLQGKLKNAENAYNKAISMTPDLMDCWKYYGDFLLEAYHGKKWAREAYLEGAKRNTADFQILGSLRERLIKVGEHKEAGKLWERMSRISRKRSVYVP